MKKIAWFILLSMLLTGCHSLDRLLLGEPSKAPASNSQPTPNISCEDTRSLYCGG